MTIINRLPLLQLPPPLTTAVALRDLTAANVRELLHKGSVRFAVAMMMSPFRVIPEHQCREFWKSEVEPHLVSDPEEGISLDEFPKGCCYFASE